jgi:hypothetical protein
MKFANSFFACFYFLFVALAGKSEAKYLRRSLQVCTSFEIAEFDCDISETEVGVYVCREGATTCSSTSSLLATDSCGCCPGDDRLECQTSPDDPAMNATMMFAFNATNATLAASSSSSSCTDAQIFEFDCDISEFVVGVNVCREGVTTCVTTSSILESDTCGCCPDDNRLECQTSPDDPVNAGSATSTSDVAPSGPSAGAGVGAVVQSSPSSSSSVCTNAQIMEFDCDISEFVVGVYVCRRGATTCVTTSSVLPSDTCGCCPGDNRLECQASPDDPMDDEGAIEVERAMDDDF